VVEQELHALDGREISKTVRKISDRSKSSEVPLQVLVCQADLVRQDRGDVGLFYIGACSRTAASSRYLSDARSVIPASRAVFHESPREHFHVLAHFGTRADETHLSTRML